MDLFIAQLPVVDMGLAHARHFPHACGFGTEVRQPEKATQESGKLMLLSITQGKAQDTVVGISQVPVPKAHINRHEGRLPDLA